MEAAAARPEPDQPHRILDPSEIDGLVISVFEDPRLKSRVRRLEKLELLKVRDLTERAIERHKEAAPDSLEPVQVHQRLLHGLSGESLLVASSLFLDSLAEAEAFFDLSFKTIKSKLGKTLDTAASERVMRAGRATAAAAEVLGTLDAARRYLHTRNYALGGSTPAELLKTSEGERVVLNELHAAIEGGPV
jgi:uncharacterized protein (DUF2384 family)